LTKPAEAPKYLEAFLILALTLPISALITVPGAVPSAGF
jgi:hypothetical protein